MTTQRKLCPGEAGLLNGDVVEGLEQDLERCVQMQGKLMGLAVLNSECQGPKLDLKSGLDPAGLLH